MIMTRVGMMMVVTMLIMMNMLMLLLQLFAVVVGELVAWFLLGWLVACSAAVAWRSKGGLHPRGVCATESLCGST